MKILVINGPNMGVLEKRSPDQYGTKALSQIEKEIREAYEPRGVTIEFFQSNHEGAIVDKINDAMEKYDAIVINPAAYTHYSYAIRDALEAFRGVKIEVHLSNIYKREEFRRSSVISPVVDGVISGFGDLSYKAAIEIAMSKLRQ